MEERTQAASSAEQQLPPGFEAFIDLQASQFEPQDRPLFKAGIFAGIYTSSDDRDEFSSERTIALLDEAVQLNNGVCSARIAHEFADIHFERLVRLGLKSDADKVEEYVRIVLEEYPKDYESIYKVMRVLHVRYLRTFSATHVTEALDLAGQTLSSMEDDNQFTALILAACGIALLDWSEANSCAESLEMASELFHGVQQREESGPRTAAWILARMYHAEALRRRFEVVGDRSDLDKALAFFSDNGEAIQLRPADDLEYGVIRMRILHTLWGLGPNMNSLQTLRRGYAELQQRSLLKNHRNPLRAELMQDTGRAFNETFMSQSQTSHGFTLVQSGLAFARELLRAWGQTGDTSPGLAPYLFQMGLAFEQQYDAYFSPRALEEACSLLMQACRSTNPRSIPFGLRQAHMMNALHKMSNLSLDTSWGQIQQLAALTLRQALTRPLPLQRRARSALAMQLGRLAEQLIERGRDPNHDSISRAIRHYEKAAELATTDMTQLVHALNSVATSLLRRGRMRASRGEKPLAEQDLESAMGAIERVNKLGEELNFTNLDNFETLGDIRKEQFDISGNVRQAEQAIENWKAVCKKASGSNVVKFSSALKMAMLQERIIPLADGNLVDIADSLAEVVEATLKVITDSDSPTEQIWKIRIFAQLASHAASTGLLAGKPPEAMVSLLERGRSLVWNRTLRRKTDVSALKAKHEDLATRFENLQKLLPRDDAAAALEGLTFQETLESDRFYVGNEYHNLIREIRQKPGFEDFMLGSIKAGELREHASRGPVVYFVQSQHCHAIVISSRSVTPVHLPQFSRDDCIRESENFREFLKLREKDATMERARAVIEAILTWLWTAAAKPVLDCIYEQLGLDAKSPPGTLPRVWWVCSGYVNTFPIHAAGDYQRARLPTVPAEPCSVMDMAISSYTPTLQALEYTRRTMDRMTLSPAEKPSAVLVGMKFTPDKSPDLINAPVEIEAVARILSGASYAVTKLGSPASVFGAAATRKAVVLALRTSTIALFACHGEAADDPVQSRLYLRDWRARPLDVAHLMRMDLDNLQLVELSACEMAVNRDAFLQEEGLHMSGAFQMAGVPNTIATWWPVFDAHATDLSRGFHEGLVVKGSEGAAGIDVRRSAAALWKVMRGMRDEGLSPAVWGAYAHFGV